MTQENQLIAQTLTSGLDFSDKEMLSTLKDNIAPEATPSEFKMFVEFCKGTGLNPFKREIWFIKTKSYTSKDGKKVEGKVQMMTGIAGFYAIANSHPQYDGMEETIIKRDGERIVRAIAKVWRKDRRFPSIGIAEFKEYCPEKNQYNNNSIWFTKPIVMISKAAESIALRKAFPNELNGLYTQEEMPKDFEVKDIAPKPAPKKLDIKTWYLVPEANAEQEQFLTDSGCVRLQSTDYWSSPRNLGTKLKKFEVESPLLDGEEFDEETGEILGENIDG